MTPWPGAVTTGLDHDAADNLTRVTDPGANTTVYTHDDLGRTTRVDSPDAGITVYGHDPAGNVTARTDANGVTVTYGYDALNRLISASFPGGGKDLAFGYDAGAYGKGRLASASDAAGSTTFTYDAPGRVTEEARVTDGISYATGYAYSPTTGDLTGMTYPTGLALTFQRDAIGRISAVTAGGQTIAGNVAYLPFGPVEAMDLGAISVTRTYDARYQVIGIQAGTALNYTYTRGGMGNISGLSGAPKPPFASGTTDYAYTANRLVSSTGAEPAAYTYDNAGNITSDGARDFVYNQNNRLVRVEAGGTVLAEYAYDGFERRVKKVAGGVTTHYHYDLNGRLIAETDGAGNPIRDYVYIDGEPVAMQVYGAEAGWYWFLNDHLGTPQKLVDNAGAVVWQAAYMPFGEARILTADVENNLRFPGQYCDVETGLHYNWHRYYDPGTGRYLRPDPIGLAGGLNLYAYALNNPTNSSDPFGLTATVIPGGAPVPFPGAHPVFQPGTPENQLIGNDLSSIFRLMDPSPLVRDVIRMITGDDGGDECNPSSESTPGMPDPEDDNNFEDKPNKIAKKLGRRPKEIRDAIHEVKGHMSRGGAKRNPDVWVDVKTGEVYPKTPRGGAGDSIGNIFDFLR